MIVILACGWREPSTSQQHVEFNSQAACEQARDQLEQDVTTGKYSLSYTIRCYPKG